MKKIGKILLAWVLGLSLLGCSEKAKETEEVTLTLAAAASLEYAFEEKIIPLYESQHPGVKIEGTYDSSGKLQQQIENGLQADLFFSAASKQMNILIEEGYILKEDTTSLLQNEVVLIVPATSQLGISQFSDILLADQIAIGDPQSVPAGQYAKEALDQLGIYDEVLSHSSQGTNVTEVLNWVAEGSADAGVVYASDAATTDKVKVVASAQKEGLIAPALYPVATLKECVHPNEAKAFYTFLQTPEVLEIFAEYGFSGV